MVRILAGFLVIVSLLTAVGGATLAVFSDTSEILGNTISTAQVDIDAHGESNNTTAPKPIDESGLVPGEWTDWFRGIVYNKADSTNVRVYMYLSNVTGAACSKTNLTVRTGFAGSDAGERANSMYDGSVAGLTGPGNRIELTGPVFHAPDWLPYNTSLVVQQAAQLDPSAGNTYTNKSCDWSEVFVAETPTLP